ncbi:hypothetical protein C5167_047241 [Papaver somniferum]|uniref:Uncharacterized protein n=1 Tax=Papaver somniferum TaxID=3469 RepID=A0A4Y7LJ01_PAPSO|nr:hypothetical protein C5167_047241 [Papaver somniferum]
MIGPVEQMSLEDYPVKGLYFMVVNSPQLLCTSTGLYMAGVGGGEPVAEENVLLGIRGNLTTDAPFM